MIPHNQSNDPAKDSGSEPAKKFADIPTPTSNAPLPDLVPDPAAPTIAQSESPASLSTHPVPPSNMNPIPDPNTPKSAETPSDIPPSTEASASATSPATAPGMHVVSNAPIPPASTLAPTRATKRLRKGFDLDDPQAMITEEPPAPPAELPKPPSARVQMPAAEAQKTEAQKVTDTQKLLAAHKPIDETRVSWPALMIAPPTRVTNAPAPVATKGFFSGEFSAPRFQPAITEDPNTSSFISLPGSAVPSVPTGDSPTVSEAGSVTDSGKAPGSETQLELPSMEWSADVTPLEDTKKPDLDAMATLKYGAAPGANPIKAEFPEFFPELPANGETAPATSKSGTRQPVPSVSGSRPGVSGSRNPSASGSRNPSSSVSSVRRLSIYDKPSEAAPTPLASAVEGVHAAHDALSETPSTEPTKTETPNDMIEDLHASGSKIQRVNSGTFQSDEMPTKSRMMAIPSSIPPPLTESKSEAADLPPPDPANIATKSDVKSESHLDNQIITVPEHGEDVHVRREPLPSTRYIEPLAPWNVEKPANETALRDAIQISAIPQVTLPPPTEESAPTEVDAEEKPVAKEKSLLEPTYVTGIAPDVLPAEKVPAGSASATHPVIPIRPSSTSFRTKSSPRGTPPPEKKSSGRGLLIAATVVITAIAGFWIYTSIQSGVKLEARKKNIDATLTHALSELQSNQFPAAVKDAQTAQSELNKDGEGVIDPEFKQSRQAGIKAFLEAGTAAAQLDAKFAEKDKDPAEIRQYFSEKKALWERQTAPEYKPLLAYLKEKQVKLDDFESEKKLGQLRELLADANNDYKAGKIDEAAKTAEKILALMVTKPVVQDQELKKRAEILSERATKLSDAEKLLSNLSSGDKTAEAKARIQSEVGKLDPANEDLKPLLARYNELAEKLEKAESATFAISSTRIMLKAESAYKAGKIEDAAALGAQILAGIPPKLAEQNRDMIRRAEMLVDHGKKLEVATQIKASAKDDAIADARKRMQTELDSLDPANADLLPLIERLKTFKTELAKDEREFRVKAAHSKKNADGTDYALNPTDAADLLKKLKKFAELDPKCVPGELDFDGYNFEFAGKSYKLCLHHEAKNTVLFLDSDDNKIAIDARHFETTDKTFRPRWHRAFYHVIALADAMKKAGVKSEEYWDTKEEAPFVSARRFDKDGNEFIFLGDRLYTGKAQEKTDQQKKIEDQFRAQAEALATAVENDTQSSEDIRKTISFAVRASAVNVDWNDHLEGEFVRKVIDEGYIETNMPGSSERLKKELAEYRAGYKVVSEPFVNFIGSSPKGEATELRTYEDRAVWRLYDTAADITTFAITNPDDEKDCLFILYDFPGKLNDMPEGKPPTQVRMTHQAVGVLSWYDPTTNAMDFDKAKWDFASTLEVPAVRDADRVTYGYGTASWSLPPHVLLIDKSGRSKALVTPYGRVDVTDFKKIADVAKRKAAMDEFLEKLTVVLPNKPEGCYQHLYFRYFFQYILDSPVTDHPDLLGSRAHTGDIHQTTYQSLERLMGGRYVGDCDDIAEMYMTLERKMGKLSYVMSLPGHAACGWVEKSPSDSIFSFYILQTGPARRFEDTTLDKVVEKAYRAFDAEGTSHFDPKSLAFNFRFNNEPTRTTYWLSSRMFVDGVYGEAMERVQSYWHFHFYALGIQTMKAMIEKGDTVSENWNEIAGLYGQVREVEDSIRCSHESIKNLDASERLSRMSEEYRIATMWRSEHDSDKAYETIRKTIVELKQIQRTQETFEYLGMRMQVAGLLLALDRPWDTWDLLRPDIELLGNPRNYFLKLEHVGTLTSAYLKMQDLIRARKVLSGAERRQMNDLLRVLDSFYSNGKAIFEESDGFDDFMRKYAYIGIYYSGKYGRKKYLEELMKDGPYPELNKKRDHENRTYSQALVDEDWKWIRLSLSSYSIAIGDSIDLDDSPDKWRIDEAVKLCDQMRKAGTVAAKYGSLASYEFVLSSNRVLRDFLKKDWADLEEVIKDTAKKNWAKGTSDIAETFGKGARFCSPEVFAQQFKMFTNHIKSKPTYFTVVYEAYRADGIKHAVAASKIALECNPGDEDMKREANYLEELANKRLKKMAEKEKADQDKKEKSPKGNAADPITKDVTPAPKN